MNKWSKFSLLYLAGTLIGMSQLKIAPVVDSLSSYLGVSLTQAALLTSIFTISGIFIAIPGGVLVTKFGAKKLLLIIMGLLAFGNFLGIFASNFYLLLISRMIEGISFSTIVMTGVVLINYWFKESDSTGKAIGIFTTFPAAATLISMNLFLPLSEKFGPFASWYLVGGLAVILTIFLFIYLEEPIMEEETSTQNKKESLFMEAAKNKQIWLLGILQGCMAFVLYAYIALYPVLFSDYYQLSTTTANFYSSLFGLFGIPFGFVAGFLIDKAKRPGTVVLSSFLMMTIACFMAPYLKGNTALIIVQVFLLSAAAMLASSSVTILVPRTVSSEKLIGYSMSFVNLFYYTCIVIGAPMISKLIENASWITGLLVLTAIAFLGVLVSLFYLLSNKNNLTIKEK